MKKKKGLTLIEVLSVIAIISILFILLTPQVNNAIDKARVTGVQTDLRSYEIGLKSYLMISNDDLKTLESLNSYLDKPLQFEEKDGFYLSKEEKNPYDKPYEFKTDWHSFVQVSSKTNKKDPKIHVLLIHLDGGETKVEYLGFDSELKESELDSIPPTIVLTPNGGLNISEIDVQADDENSLKDILYSWSTDDKEITTKWSKLEEGEKIFTNTLSNGTYYLHIQAIDNSLNLGKVISSAFQITNNNPADTNTDIGGGSNIEPPPNENPIIKLSPNGNTIKASKHSTTITVTDDGTVSAINYAWATSTAKPSFGWVSTSNNSIVSTPNGVGDYYLHVEATDNLGSKTEFISQVFKNADLEKPVITLSVNGNSTNALTHTTKINVTDNTEVEKIEYVWSESSTAPTTGWATISNDSDVTSTETENSVYLYVRAIDIHDNSTDFKSNVFVQSIYNFSEIDSNNISIIGYKGTKFDINIPTYIDGKKVVKIGDDAFAKGTETSQNIGSTIISVTIPSSVTHIGERAFSSNQLTSIIIPNSVTYIGKSAFYYNKLTSATIPNSVTYIGSSAFYQNQLASVNIPSNLITIESYAFSGNKLTSISIPNSVTSIGDYAFRNNLITSVTIPNSVTTIGTYAFSSNKLVSATIPSSVTSIGTYAFSDNSLTSINIPNTITRINEGVFFGNALTSVTLPNNLISIDKYVFQNNKLSSVVIPNSVNYIGHSAFRTNELISLTLPNNLTSIGDYVFTGNKLTSINIPNTVTSIGKHTFYDNALTSIKIPSGVTSINQSAFKGNVDLTTVTNCSNFTFTSLHFDVAPTYNRNGC